MEGKGGEMGTLKDAVRPEGVVCDGGSRAATEPVCSSGGRRG